MNSEGVLVARGISKTYPGVRALVGVDLTVGAGEVHALLGENGAGKSTLMKIMAGSVVPDAGELRLVGKVIPFGSPEAARAAGVSIVYQELSLVPTLTVAENVMLGRWPTRWGVVAWDELRDAAVGYLRRVGLEIPPETRVAELGMAERQLVEIAKALSVDPVVLLLDEPTSALSEGEARRLFGIIRDLTATGVAVIYVSHRLGEVVQIADRVTVLRDGHLVATRSIEEVTEAELARMMVGREVHGPRVAAARVSSRTQHAPALRAQRLGRPPRLRDIHLELYEGEIVSVFGLVGSGRSELARVLFGLDPPTTGTLEVMGRSVQLRSPADAIALGMGYVAPDRALGVVPLLSVAANITLAAFSKAGKGPFIDQQWEEEQASRYIEELDIKVQSPYRPAGGLSGGNQQKVILGRWLCSGARILILDDPTRGIDVGAKEEVFRLVRRLAEDGAAVLYATSEISEARVLGNRILVMSAGTIATELEPETEEAEIMAAAGGVRG
ncbi:MAG: ABC transporter ATP-binding protein [Acidimicrobiia bacterium]|nr:MAG: ABC transporter ATP-binding protein [Acidimicrobiia bacterium]